MSEARLGAIWSPASEILAAIYNTVRDSKKRSKPYSGADFNPLLQKHKETAPKVGIEALSGIMGRKFKKESRNGISRKC
jgi:hypothetical protein